MDKLTHARSSARVVALLDETGKHGVIVRFLAPWVGAAALGAWIRDQAGAHRAGGCPDRQVPKMATYTGKDSDRFVAGKKDLSKELPKESLALAGASQAPYLGTRATKPARAEGGGGAAWRAWGQRSCPNRALL